MFALQLNYGCKVSSKYLSFSEGVTKCCHFKLHLGVSKKKGTCFITLGLFKQLICFAITS